MEEKEEEKKESKSLNVFPLGIDDIIIQYLEKLHLNLGHYWALLGLVNKNNINIPPSVLSALERRNYVINGNITESGVKLVHLLDNPNSIPNFGDIKKELKKLKLEHDTKFLEWWNLYPVGNTWVDKLAYGEKIYEGTRGFRTKKDDCEKLYLQALANGELHQDMLDAISYEVDKRKIESRKSGQNKLDYIVNTHSYLLNKLYLNYIEMMKIEKYQSKNKSNSQLPTQGTMLI